MGVVSGITGATFPAQSHWVGGRVEVIFNHDTANAFGGVIVRDDAVHPFVTVIRLDGGHVLSTECQHSPPKAGGA